ncbi:MAG: response regulator [Thermomicrobiales bacterium]
MPDRRLLVVEDDADIRRLLVDVLVDEGHEVREAESGAEALALLQEWAPDLILLDMTLPEMDGRAFRAAQRRLPPPASQAPVVIVTGMYDHAALVEELDAVALLRKPFDLDELVALVEALSISERRQSHG